MIRKPCCSRFSLHKFVHLKYFWTQFKNVHLRGPCSSRPCISRPYCTSFFFAIFQIHNSKVERRYLLHATMELEKSRLFHTFQVIDFLVKSCLLIMRYARTLVKSMVHFMFSSSSSCSFSCSSSFTFQSSEFSSSSISNRIAQEV